MRIEVESAKLLSVGLVATRFSAMLAMTPVLGFSTLPVRVRVLFVLVVSVIIAAAAGFPLPTQEQDGGTLALTFAQEALLGAVMGFGILCCFGALMLAGRILDYQMGFATALMFDPSSRTQAPLFGTVLTMLGAVLFLAMDAHHSVVSAIVWSLRVMPPSPEGYLFSGTEVLSWFGLMFAYGFALVAPAVAVLMLIDIGVAVSARTMPQVNAYFVALPVKVFTGILVLGLSLKVIEPVITQMFGAAARQIAPPVTGG